MKIDDETVLAGRETEKLFSRLREAFASLADAIELQHVMPCDCSADHFSAPEEGIEVCPLIAWAYERAPHLFTHGRRPES